MNSKKLTLALLVLIGLVVGLTPATVHGTASQLDETTFMMTADNDSLAAFASTIPYGTRVKSVKVTMSGTTKFYQLRKTSQSGNLLYEQRSTSVTSQTLAADPVNFMIPVDGSLYFNTDDADTTNVKIIIYTGQ